MGDIVRKQKNGKFIGWYVRYIDLDGRRKQRASHQPTWALARRLPQARCVPLPGTGHLAHEEQPSQVAALITRAWDGG